MYVSVFSELRMTTQPPARVPIDKVLERIKDGENGLKEIIEGIRTTEDDQLRENLKKSLGAVIFTGYCGNGIDKVSRATGYQYKSYRTDKSLSEHAGFAVFDLDHVEDVEKWKAYFKTIRHVYAAFRSPSGDGLKVIYKIPKDLEMHRNHYRAILNDMIEVGAPVDSTSVNEARLCFMSYDPDIYINTNAEVYTDFLLQEEQNLDDAAIKKGSGLTDYNKLAIAAQMIDNARQGEKHRTLVKAAYLMGGYIESGFIDEEDARAMLRKRIRAKDVDDLQKAYDTIEDGLEQGRHKPIYEIEQIEEEFKITNLRRKYQSEEREFTFLIDRTRTREKVLDIIANGVPQGLPTGIEALDKHFRYKENNFSVFLGHDNVGKSTFVWWAMVVSSMKHGWKWVVYCPENDIEKIIIHMMEFVIGKKAKRASSEQIRIAESFVDKHFYFVRKDKVYNIFELLEFGRVMCDNDKKIKGFLIDPYNSLALDYKNQGQGLNSYEYHMRAISEIRIFAETHCSVYVNAHSVTGSRRQKVDDNGDIPRPYKSDIDQGAIWANRCDDFYVIHRQVKNEDTWNITQLHVDKVKDTDTGTQITRGEHVELELYMQTDFVASGSDWSPLKDCRANLFKIGKQSTMDLGNTSMEIPHYEVETKLPTIDPKDAFE